MNDTPFFTQLAEFSRRLLTQQHLPGTGSPWGVERAGAHPKGAVLHYTADSNMQSVLRWFCDPDKASQASAHVVVGQRRYDWAEGFDYDLPLVKALPVTVVQCRPPRSTAWHATWANAMTYGLELINTGEIRGKEGAYYWWPPLTKTSADWTTPWTGPNKPVALYNRLWEPYPVEQVRATVIVLREVHKLFDGSLQPSWVVGHEHVQGTSTAGGHKHDKRDPGLAFPIHAVRAGAFGADLGTTPPDVQAWRVSAAARVLDACALGVPGGNAMTTFLARAQNIGGTSKPRVMAKGGLYLLGYNVEQILEPTCTPAETASVWLFQKLMGMEPDGQLGPKTYEALGRRLADRFGA